MDAPLAEQVRESQRQPPSRRDHLLRELAVKSVRERDQKTMKEIVAAASESGDFRLLGEMLLEDGFLSFALGASDAALASYRKAGDCFREAGDRAGQAQSRLRETDIYLRRIELGKVQKELDEVSATVAELKIPGIKGDYYRQLEYLAFIRGDHDKTVDYAGLAIRSYRAAGHHVGLSQVHRILGDLYCREGDLQQSLSENQLALEEGRAGGEPIFIGRALFGIGYAEFRRDDFEKALTSFAEAREVFAKARYPVGVGDVSHWEGEIYRIMGDGDRALESYRHAFSSYSSAGSRVGMGNSLQSQGRVHHQMKNWKTALAFYERARNIYSDQALTNETDWVDGLAEVNYRKGSAQQDMGELTGALATLEQALRLCRIVGDKPLEADIILCQGEIKQRLGDSKQARELYTRAREAYERLGSHDSLSLALFHLAGLARQEGRMADAAIAYEGSIREAEKLRTRAGMDILKRTFLAKVIDRYEEAAVFMISQKQPERAFTLAEGMKARAFLDQLAESAVDVTSGIDPVLKLQRDQLEAQRDQASERLRSDLTGKKASSEYTRLKKDLDDLDRQLEELRGIIRRNNPVYGGIHYPEPVDVKELRKQLHDDELLVEYFLGGDAAYRFLVGRDVFKVERLALGRSELEQEVTETLAAFTGEDSSGSHDQPLLTNSLKERLAKLYYVLIGSIGEAANGKRLVIVPDGNLARFPFEMLVTRLNPLTFAVQVHDIQYIQSATVLVMQRTIPRPSKPSGGFIGFGDPVYDYEHFMAKQPERGSTEHTRGGRGLARSGYLRVGGILTRLEGSGREVTEISAKFSARNIAPVTLLRDRAREEAAKGTALSGYSYIHFSTHGILDHNFQALALTQDPSSKEDGFLTFGKIMNSRYTNARLVVLSACETGLGIEERGEGVTGLTRAVMYAGSPAVVVSLWKVDDEETRKLMTELYGLILERGLSPLAALRQAKLALLADDDELTSSPFSWAPFILYGE
jgi:CHAT domain-containing protein